MSDESDDTLFEGENPKAKLAKEGAAQENSAKSQATAADAPKPMSLFFFGMGYSSNATAKAIFDLIDPDIPVVGTTRSRPKAEELIRAGVKIHAFDGRASGLMLSLDLVKATHVILSIPPNEGVDPVLAHHRDDLDKMQDLQWLCYFSTVGVYGNADGAWIDETSACNPENERSKLRIQVEKQWISYARSRDIPLVIFRLAGIYGPERSALDKLRAGTAHRIIKEGQVFNRIHVDDIGRVTALAAKKKLSGIFNLTDDEPAPPQDLVSFAAELADIKPPKEVPFEKADITDMARSFYSDNKRVSNAAIKLELGIEFLYPTYREGLQAVHDLELSE